jgi:hypothetical protein
MKSRKGILGALSAIVFTLCTLPVSTATAGSVDISPTSVGSSNVLGCVSTLATDLECPPAGINLLDNEDDTIRLFNLDVDVAGFQVAVDSEDSSDIGSASVLLNDDLVGIISTENPFVSAVFADPSVAQVIQIVNTDAALLNYRFSATPVPVPAAVWLFGSGLLGLIGIARRKKTA